MHTDKKGIRLLVAICKAKGLKDIIISPGSRNAPLVIEFTRNDAFRCLVVPDERSAAFVALGMAQQSGLPTAIICTSGTAPLNYSPALAEAYYQRIPLVAITADRPAEWIGQEDGQAINQQGIFKNFVRRSVTLPQEPADEADFWYLKRIVSETIDIAMGPVKGPVHLNVPLREPLYRHGFAEEQVIKLPSTVNIQSVLQKDVLKKLVLQWNSCNKKMIICGGLLPSSPVQGILSKFIADPSLILLSESTSNLSIDHSIDCIDRVLATIPFEDEKALAPSLLITLGGPVVSRKIKDFIRRHKPTYHWHLDPDELHIDTYQSLTSHIPLNPEVFLNQLLAEVTPALDEVIPVAFSLLAESSLALSKPSTYREIVPSTPSTFRDKWLEKDALAESVHQDYMQDLKWSDMKVFETVLQNLPEGSDLQMGNSTPVRYIQLFKASKQLNYFGNRGTSGIDGCVSTAVGACISTGKLTILVVGDMAFFYDTNGLWHHHVPSNLRIILINNGGGGIFRIIQGPSSIPELEQFFETRHKFNAKNIAITFGLDYSSCSSLDELKEQLPLLFSESDNSGILEIFTPYQDNADVLSSYFKFISGRSIGL